MLSRAVFLRAGVEIIRESILQELLVEQGKKKNERKKREIRIHGSIFRRKILRPWDTLLMGWSSEAPDYVRKRLRMTTDQFETLVQQVTPLIQKCYSNMREALLPHGKSRKLVYFGACDFSHLWRKIAWEIDPGKSRIRYEASLKRGSGNPMKLQYPRHWLCIPQRQQRISIDKPTHSFRAETVVDRTISSPV